MFRSNNSFCLHSFLRAIATFCKSLYCVICDLNTWGQWCLLDVPFGLFLAIHTRVVRLDSRPLTVPSITTLTILFSLLSQVCPTSFACSNIMAFFFLFCFFGHRSLFAFFLCCWAYKPVSMYLVTLLIYSSAYSSNYTCLHMDCWVSLLTLCPEHHPLWVFLADPFWVFLAVYCWSSNNLLCLEILAWQKLFLHDMKFYL